MYKTEWPALPNADVLTCSYGVSKSVSVLFKRLFLYQRLHYFIKQFAEFTFILRRDRFTYNFVNGNSALLNECLL